MLDPGGLALTVAFVAFALSLPAADARLARRRDARRRNQARPKSWRARGL